MSEIDRFVGTLHGAHREQAIKCAVSSLSPDAFPPVPFDERIAMKVISNWHKLSLYRREELCTHTYREALIKVLRSCGIGLDEFLMSELVRRPDLQDQLLSIVTPYSEELLHPEIRSFLAFVRDGVRARLLIDRLFANGIVVLQNVEKKDERGIVDCFKRSSLGLSLETLETDAMSAKGRYVIKPYHGTQELRFPDNSQSTFRYQLEDASGKFNEGFYFHNKQWRMASLNIMT